VGTILALGSLSRHNEVIAMRSSGVGLGMIVLPILGGGLLMSVLSFVNNELVTPVYAAKANHILNVEIQKKKELVFFRQRKLWLRGPDNSIVNIDFIAPDRDVMLGLNIFKLNSDYTVRERIKAGRLVWENGSWYLKDSIKYIRSGDTVRSTTADNEIYNIIDNPGSLGMIVKSSDELSFTELWDYVRRLRNSGYVAARYEVDLFDKLSFPLSSLLMVMIAAPLSLERVRSGGPGKGIAFAVFITFGYWALMSVGSTLGRSGAAPPYLASWVADAVFGVLSAFSLIRLHRNE
jgi:lipopolysaccharide export system permease protein